MNLNENMLIVDDYLSNEECDSLFDLFTKTDFPSNISDGVWSYRVKWPQYTEQQRWKLEDNRTRVCEQYFGKRLKILNVNMTLWRESDEMPPHSDYGARNEFPNREYASIIYMNDDFEGGEIYIPDLNFEMKPKKGRLICFRGGILHHGVRAITKGMRLTNICWFEVIN